MKRMRLEVELEYDDEIMHGDDKESFDWFIKEIIRGPNLILHDNDMGDTVGTVKVSQITLLGPGWPE